MSQAESVALGAAAPAPASGASTAMTADGKPISDQLRFGMLIVLAATFGLNMADRGIVATLIPLIKAEMTLTDSQVGFIIGPMFAIVYGLMGLPIATIADRSNRRNLLAATTALFSGATAACGAASSYLHLCIARFFVGVGEAGTQPASNSIIADMFPPEKRTSAIAIFTSGGSCGMILAGLVGGIIAHQVGWREAFVAAGVPGLILAVVTLIVLKEPARVVSQKVREQKLKTPIGLVLKTAWKSHAFRWIVLGDIFLVFHNRGSSGFTNLFLVQTHGFNVQTLGIVHAVFGVVGVACVVMIGRMIDRGTKTDMRWLVWTPAIVAGVGIPTSLVMLTVENGWAGVIVNGLGGLVGGAYLAPLLAGVQAVVPNAMRGRAVALLVTVAMLAGMGVGPMVTGVLSDTLAQHIGSHEALRWSLIVMLIPNVIACWCFWVAARDLRQDVNKAKVADGLA
jgi:predicted MFS family arabinose efflux permease